MSKQIVLYCRRGEISEQTDRFLLQKSKNQCSNIYVSITEEKTSEQIDRSISQKRGNQ